MANKLLSFLIVLSTLTLTACHSSPDTDAGNAASTDSLFANFETRFLDAYWQEHPSASIFIGYGKYYDNLVIPDSSSIENNETFLRQWTDSLAKLDYNALSDNNKISYSIIKNQLESDHWYESVFKPQEWDPSAYNLSGECDYLLNQPYAGLDQKLQFIGKHFRNAPAYYAAALRMLHTPTKEHLQLAILQNQGGLSVFGQALADSIKASHLTENEKDSLKTTIANTVTAIKAYIDSLKAIDARKQTTFRDFRIGKKLFAEKFKYDLAIDGTPEELYAKAQTDLEKDRKSVV